MIQSHNNNAESPPAIDIRPAIQTLTPYPGGRDADSIGPATGYEGPFVKLSSNEGAEGPFPAAVTAIQAALAGTQRYPDASAKALQNAIAEFHAVSPEEVLVAAGGSGVLRHLTTAFLEPGDEIAYCAPTFHLYGREAKQAGARPVTAPLDSGGAYDLDALQRIITSRTRVVFVCTPNNPTGGLVERTALERFLQALPAHVLAVIDEAYFEYVESPQYPQPERIRRATRRQTVTVRTFSKIYGLAGLRVGYAIAPPEIVEACQKVKIPYEVNRLGQAAAVATLNSQGELARRRTSNGRLRAQMVAELVALGMQPMPSQANFVCLKVGEAAAVAQALEAHGVIVRPLDAMGDSSSVRVTVGNEVEVQRFLEAFGAVVKAGQVKCP
jgi:histidinol-phosphate aminotransferase